MTLRFVYGQDRNVAQFVAQRIPHIDPRGFPTAATAIGIVDGHNNPLAGFVYYDWSVPAGTVYIAAAAQPGKRWVSRETVRHMLGYPFEVLNCQMVLFRVRADNVTLRRHLGVFFDEEILIPRLYGRDVDGVLITCTAERWRAHRYYAPFRQQEAA